MATSVLVAAVVQLGPARAEDASGAGPLCSERSWVGGTTEWCDGSLVYRDYVYDDTGADTASGSPHGASSNAATGDVVHTAHGESLNAADLLVLRLRAEPGGLAVRFELNTLLPGDATIAALAVDLDDDASTGGGAWPGIAVASAGWERVDVFHERDIEANVIEGFVSMALPRHGMVRIQAVVALGDGTPMNVAFRPAETGDWWEARQSAALAAGDISAFGERVAAEDLRTIHRPHRPAGLQPGFHERVYRSEVALGEGVGAVYGETGSEWTFLGHHQPYAIYVPDPIPDDVQLVLHGAGNGHAALVSGDGAQAVMGDGQRRILASPLGRGDTGGYVDWSARDVLDVLADVEAAYDTDPDTVVLSGYSMGGGGTLTLAAWFPDRFAAAVAWVPFTGDCLNGTPLAQGDQRPEALAPFDSNAPDERSGCPLATRGNVIDLFGNYRHVPVAALFGAADELVWATHAAATMARLADLGYEHRVWLHTAEHLTFGILDDWRNEAAWSAERVRVRHPAHVTYRTNTYLWFPELDLVPDGAYWVDQLRPRVDVASSEGDMVADLTSHACATGDDEVTVRHDAGLEPLPWIGQEGIVVGTTPLDGARRITGTLTNVASVLIDVDAACLTGADAIDIDIATDGPTVVHFSDGRPSVSIS